MAIPAAWRQLNVKQRRVKRQTARMRAAGRSPGGPDPPQAAKGAGPRDVNDETMPGIRRTGRGSRVRYIDADGRAVKDSETLGRIRSLAIPPAWTNVWICPHANGHVQATGRDARGRKQYRYHARWREVRD